MMPLLAPARLTAHESGAAAHAARTGRLPSHLFRRRGASALLSLACLMPLAACAAQPAQQGAAESPAAAQPAAAAAPAQQQAPAAPAAREQQGAAMPATQPPAATPARTAPANASRPATPAPAAGNAPSPIAPQERATTVGEVPTTAQSPENTPPAQVVPGAPAAIPGTPANPVTIPQPAPGPSAGSLVQTIFALVLVLALLAALAWLAKRYGPKIAGGGGNLRMVGALNIGGRERIMVVEVGDQWIVVGASPGRINALATMPKQEATAAGGVQSGATLAGQAPSATSFSDWLKQTIDKRNAK
ncbi:flagellar biosynthetic protein FliO [Massilia sp.]|uniref:flagellar biosynthetic protein FliO n=1 Tax=Massilia sp. TaxID=1882437 RepID=UPI0028AA9197|nr:flagellar biosynthetic protein FliO [Massilia sp.]